MASKKKRTPEQIAAEEAENAEIRRLYPVPTVDDMPTLDPFQTSSDGTRHRVIREFTDEEPQSPLLPLRNAALGDSG